MKIKRQIREMAENGILWLKKLLKFLQSNLSSIRGILISAVPPNIRSGSSGCAQKTTKRFFI